MKVGIIQSNFLPWRGYFDFIREVDLFVLHDDLQYTKNDWRNRNKIKTNDGSVWITAPVCNTGVDRKIEETELIKENKWKQKILGRVRQSYHKAPYFHDYFGELEFIIENANGTISELNYDLIMWICNSLKINTPIIFSRDLNVVGKKTERLISILNKVEATHYLSGPAAKNYIKEDLFERENIKLEYKEYNYPEYKQLYPPFDPAVSIIDLLFMHGKESAIYLDSI